MKSLTKRVGSAGAVSIVFLGLVGCSALPWGADDSSPTSSAGLMLVEVAIRSDVDTAAQVDIDVDTIDDPQRVEDENVTLPFAEQFDVSTAKPFPLRGVTVEATATPDARWIECEVSLDGDVIAKDRAEGPGATATCTKELRLGPQ